MALTDLTRISTAGIATGSTIDSPILRKDVDFRGNQVGVTSVLFDSSEKRLDLKEIEDAQWFSLDQIKKLNHPNLPGGFKLPREDSIARRLVNHWLNKNID